MISIDVGWGLSPILAYLPRDPTVGSTIPRQVGGTGKVAEHEAGSKPISNASSWSLFQFLPLGSHLELLLRLPSVMACNV